MSGHAGQKENCHFTNVFLLLMMILFICSSGEHRLFPRAAALGPGEGGYPPGVDMAQPLLSSTGGQCHRKAE